MIPRWIELYKDKALGGDSGTETFPIKRNWQILELLLNVRSKNGSNHNSADAAAQQTVEEAITKIEVKSGSATFKQFNAEICRLLATYRNGVLPPTLHTQVEGGTYTGHMNPGSGWQEYQMPIYFNSEYDPYADMTKMVLPAPLYDSLDLVLEYDFTADNDAGFATGGTYHVFNLYALVIPKEPKENMMQKRILVETKKQDYTTVASGDEPFDLTLSPDRFLRRLMIQCYETPASSTGVGEGVDITELDLKVDGDTLWAGKWGDLQLMNALDKKINYVKQIFLKANTTTDEIWTRIPAAEPAVTPWIDSDASSDEDPVYVSARSADVVTVTTAAADDLHLLTVRSPVLPTAAVFDLDKDGSLRHMQYCGVKDLDIVLTNGGAGGSVQFIEQHVSRPWGVD